MQLSRARIGLEDPKINKDGFMEKEIDKFYNDNEAQVKNVFKKQE